MNIMYSLGLTNLIDISVYFSQLHAYEYESVMNSSIGAFLFQSDLTITALGWGTVWGNATTVSSTPSSCRSPS